ncbi:MAG: hypothetical protein OEO20_11460 [Gemmatimonadota bacterium]|nr:hypothetical protein [Gemmatimonadota bacterium]MDH3366522.1 hypothetical protein [Gemmatimonadota bacterium]MDH3478911.1 hypothetical protein [Gemmatimonadota bacterium]
MDPKPGAAPVLACGCVGHCGGHTEQGPAEPDPTAKIRDAEADQRPYFEFHKQFRAPPEPIDKSDWTHIVKTDNWKHRAANMRCQTCMFYVPKVTPSPRTAVGRCRERSPTLKGWPAVFPTDWCGAHKLDEAKL